MYYRVIRKKRNNWKVKATNDSVIKDKNLIGSIQGDSSPNRQIVAGSVLFQ
jgi:hypothetical protein